MSKKRSKKKQKKKQKKKAKAEAAEAAASAASTAPASEDSSTHAATVAETPTEAEVRDDITPDETDEPAVSADSAASEDTPEEAAISEEDEATPAESIETPENKSIVAAEPLAKKDAWNPVSVGFNLLGVILAIGLSMVGGKKTYGIFDQLWLQHLGESQAYVTDVKAVETPEGKTRYETTVLLEKKGKFPEAKVKVYDKRLYNYVRHRFHPPRQLRIKVVRVHRTLSNQAGISQAGPLRLIRPPKSADLIIGLGLFVLGGAICFSSLRDLRKRWLRRGLHA